MSLVASNSPQSEPFRADIEGLRAIAVAAVIFNHIDPRLIPSGYLGVDLFFVISGYVITKSLWSRPHQSLSSFLSDFYARRFRRIIPALLLCIGVTAWAVWFVDPQPRVSFETGLSAILGLSNFYLLYLATDYFAQTTAMNVFTHTWSLGVEEQFYLLFPLLIYWAQRATPASVTQKSLGVLLVIGAASLTALFVLPGLRGGAAYFLPFGRFWEFACGACMVLLPKAVPQLVRLLRHSLSQALALFVVMGVLFLPLKPSAAWAVLCVPPMAILMLGGHASGWQQRGLEAAPLRLIGRWSYSLYLWHWPVIAISLMFMPQSPDLMAVQIALMSVLSFLTYTYVEKPFRTRLPGRGSGLLFLSYAGVMLGVALFVLGCARIPNTEPAAMRAFARNPAAFPEWAGSRSNHERDCVIVEENDPRTSRAFDLCTLRPLSPDRPMIWVMGDSHAGHLRGFLATLREKTGDGIHLVETQGLSFPLPREVAFKPRTELWERVRSSLRKGDVIVLSRLFFDRQNYLSPVAALTAWANDVAALAQSVDELGVKIVVVGPPPIFRFAAIGACRPLVQGGTSCDELRLPLAAATADIRRLFAPVLAQNSNLFYFDTFAVLCPAARLSCSPVENRMPLYRDKDHLNGAGAAALADAFIAFLAKDGGKAP